MSTNKKADFIADLLKDKKLSIPQKERIFELTAKEKDLTVLMEIDKIKEEINIIKELNASVVYIESKPISKVDVDEFLKLNEEVIIQPIEENQIISFDNELDLTIDNPTSYKELRDKWKKTLYQKIEEKNYKKDIEVNNISYLDPLNTIRFLTEFNENKILKYTCHNVDEEALTSINKLVKSETYNFELILKKIKNEYFVLNDNYKNKISRSLKGLVGEYINNYIVEESKKGWSEDGIKMTWSSPELMEWCKLNPGKCPNIDDVSKSQFEIPPINLKCGDRLNTFREVVLHFKKQIQFRFDNPLRSHIELINFEFKEQAKFDIEEVQLNFQFFSDVDKVKQAYRKIIKMGIEHQKLLNDKQPEFKISLTEKKGKKNGAIVLSILHKNSIFGKTIQQLKERNGETFTSLIKDQINGICDLKIKAIFENNSCYEIMKWPEGKEKKINELIDGVQFELIFKKIS